MLNCLFKELSRCLGTFRWTVAIAVCGTMLLTDSLARAADYVVGPGQDLLEVDQVPWEKLEPGDIVSIHARTEPYRAKWVLCRRGTPEHPITVRGIPDSEGRLPVIDGRDARTRRELNFWGEERGVIKIGGANRPADTMPAHLIIENLDIRSAREPYRFTGRNGDSAYAKNAAAIFVEKGEFITVRGCTIHDSGNGFFTSPATRDILVEHCFIHSNGVVQSILEHNNYTSTAGITFQFNHFGPLREGCLGNNLKDRSAGLIVRYNWMEGGNRVLDLVDAEFEDNPAYHQTLVYGNILIKLDDLGNNQVVHYGGDSGKLEQYRQGELTFFNNTVVSYRSGTTTLFRLSSPAERVACHNNIFFTTAPGRNLAVLAELGSADLYNNWFSEGFRPSHARPGGAIQTLGNTLTGKSPGFVDVQNQLYQLTVGSPCTATGELVPSSATELPLEFQYLRHQQQQPRSPKDPVDLGALESDMQK